MPVQETFGKTMPLKTIVFAAFLSGCATQDVNLKHQLTDECLHTVAVTDPNKKTETTTRVEFDKACGDHKVELAQEGVKTKVKEALWESLKLTIPHELARPDSDPVYTKELLNLIKSEMPEIQQQAVQTLADLKIKESDLWNRFVQDEVKAIVAKMPAPEQGAPDWAVVEVLREIYDGETYPRAERSVVQKTIDEALRARGTQMAQLRAQTKTPVHSVVCRQEVDSGALHCTHP